MRPLTVPIPCLIWPDYEAGLTDDRDFHIDSPRAGGRYEFYLPQFNIKLPPISAQTVPTAGGGTEHAYYNRQICGKMQQVLDKYRNKRQPLLFEAMLSRLIYNTREHIFEITPSDLEVAKHLASHRSAVRKTLTIEKRAGFLAKHLALNPNIPKGHFSWQGLGVRDFAREAMAASCSRDFAELVEAAQFLENKEYIKLREFGQEERISVKIQPSLLDAYAAPKTTGDKDECFVAMSFAKKEKLKALYRAIQLAAERAGYRAVRVDRIEHINKIDDEIIARIREAKFVIADLTEQNCGVYYESGYADGLGRKIIYTCEQHDIKNVHFDINHNNILLWEEEQLEGEGEFARRLQLRIKSNFDKGNYKPEKPEE